MADDSNSFLPRIQSVFYAVFDVNKGPKVVYQVPEGLIGVPMALATSSVSPSHVSLSSASLDRNGDTSRSSSSLSFPRNFRQLESPGTPGSSRNKRSISSNKTLFNFEDVSRYVIPQSFLCGRLVTFATKRHRTIGFPVELYGERYERNYFRYNLCFVFERSADVSCYEPVVRKISRVLTTCEEESSFLSSPTSSPKIYHILEKLYELNSDSEMSILIDEFNSIELRLFPFYPNPPPLHDWQVPVALIDLKQRIEPNWDLAMAKVCTLIDGASHVSKIAHEADCDIDFARKAISHLLYYQVIMMIDIFQFSNMYTLRKSIQWLADESHVRDDCGAYVAQPDRDIPDWPKLLYLYSRLKPGITVYEWMQENEVHKLNVDPRRFISFGVIKGFLRRVHRWPVLLVPDAEKGERKPVSPSRRRGKSLISTSTSVSPFQDLRASATTLMSPTSTEDHIFINPKRRSSDAEKFLEHFRREVDQTGTIPVVLGPGGISSRRGSRASPQSQGTSSVYLPSGYEGLSRRHSTHHQPYSLATPSMTSAPMPPSIVPSTSQTASDPSVDYGGISTAMRPRLSRSPSSQSNAVVAPPPQYPLDMKDLLDGSHHTDELGVRFEAGWPLLEKYLVAIGEGQGGGDFGRVKIIYH